MNVTEITKPLFGFSVKAFRCESFSYSAQSKYNHKHIMYETGLRFRARLQCARVPWPEPPEHTTKNQNI